MGLDMYLERFPRYKDYGPQTICGVDGYAEWKKSPTAQEYSLEDWCGVKEDSLPKGADMDYLRGLTATRYYAWDDEKRHPHEGVREHVGYWRKANAIHKWFVDHVQDGEDDCEYHHEVTKEVLEQLRDVCKTVLDSAVMMPGKVTNGYRWTKSGEEPILEDGMVVVNPDVCRALLPNQSGFFFGSMEYDHWYIDDVRATYELCCKLLEETDFDKQMIYYRSSW